MKKIWVIGIGMGNPDTLTLQAKKIIDTSEILIGAQRMVDSVCGASSSAEEKAYLVTAEKIAAYIDSCQDDRQIAVVLSGDPGFFSGAKKLVPLLEQNYQVELIPGISSLQYFCAKLHTAWEDANVVSLHGKEEDFIGEIQSHRKTFLLTDTVNTPGAICRALSQSGLGQVKIAVGERLSYADERITKGCAEDLQFVEFHPLSVVLVENDRAMQHDVVTHGLEDDAFIRGKVPMTKSEVRSITLSKLQLRADDVVYDIGAGTGSVSVEMAVQAVKGRVYAVETTQDGLDLIAENKAKFGLTNLFAVPGLAPKAMGNLPAPDKVFIGGSKGNMEEIIHCVIKKNPDVRIVINVIALETLSQSLEAIKNCGLELVDVVQVSAARGKTAGAYHLMMGQNPVFVLTAQRKEAIG